MIMVHKPVHLLSSPAIHHRRLSSAPSPVVVQPTRTPGLLSLSKPAPARQQPRRQPRAPKPKTSLATPVVSSEPVKDVAPLKAASPAPGKDVSSGPKLGKAVTGPLNDKDTNVKPSSRGRQRAKAVKGKADPRGASPSSARTGTRHRQAHHQGSPPQSSPIASQAEAKENADRSQSLHARSGNQFDPFLSTSSDSESDSRRSPSPAVQKAIPEPKLTRPSGKLARRRAAQHTNIPTSPTPAKAVPVPRAQGLPARDSSVMQMSRSAPGSGAASGLAQSRPARSDMFPICDDMTDVDEDERVPTTPTRPRATWQQQGFFDEGPRTAPLSSAFPGGPFFSARASTPSPIRRRPSHARSPSEGVFNLSFEEDSSSPSSSADEELKALVGLLPRRRMVPVTSTPPSSKRSAGIRPPNFFASSTFQNSPSPEDLPAPMF